MQTIPATGKFARRDTRPTISVSGGRGNTDRPEVHLQLTTVDDSGETTVRVMGWFDAADLVDAIVTHAGPPSGPLPENVVPVNFSARNNDQEGPIAA